MRSKSPDVPPLPGKEDAGASPEPDAGRPMVASGRRGGIKSASNRPAPADEAARRKAALHALRHAFVAADDGVSSGPPKRATKPTDPMKPPKPTPPEES